MIAIDGLIALAVTVAVLSTVGLIAMRDAADRLHYVGPLTTVAPGLIALAIVVEDGFTSQAGLKSLAIAMLMLLTSPIVSYATLRAIATRARGAAIAAGEPIVQS